MATAKSTYSKYPKHAYLYVLGVPGGPFKIGYSYSPYDRASAMIRAGHHGCYVVHEEQMSYWVAMPAERYAHWLLRDHHIQSEWFNVTEEQAVEAVRSAARPEMIASYDYRHMIPNLCAADSPLKGGETIKTKFSKGTQDRLRAILGTDGHSDFIRTAVEAELKRRERKPKPGTGG